MPNPVAVIRPSSTAEHVLRDLDQRPARVVVALAAVIVVGPDARTVVAAMHHTHELAHARRDACALAIELATLGERNVGVAVVHVILRPDTAETWPPSASERWLVADVAAVIALARFLAWLDVQLDILAMRAGAYDQPPAQPSNLERFAQALGRGLPPDAAAAVATGRVQ